jgi:hypothetical protein
MVKRVNLITVKRKESNEAKGRVKEVKINKYRKIVEKKIISKRDKK